MAGDLNREASELWNSLKPIIDKEIDARTQGVVQRRKAKVTTAPSLVTNTIGVTEPFGTEMFLPFNTNIMSASVGDFVWVEYMYGMTNAFVSMFASADEKDWDVAGDLSVGGNAGISGNLGVSGSTSLQNTTVNGVLDITPRRCYAALSSVGWYRILQYSGDSQNAPLGAPSFIIRFGITRHVGSGTGGEAHEITMTAAYNGSITFSNEISNSKELVIDKIRYTHSGNNAYVDIHYNKSGANTVVVDFDVDARQYVKEEIVSQPFTSVATSPSGETVLAEYSFAKNTYDFEAATKDSNFNATTFNFNAYRRGDVIIYYYNIRVPALAAETEVTMGTFSSLVPPTAMNLTVSGQAGGVYLLQFKANGTVTIYSTSGASAQFVRGTITIPVIH